MSWPTATEYSEAIQNLGSTMRDPELRAGMAATNTLGTPLVYSGGLGCVFKIVCSQTGKVYAVKCFTREVLNLQERYRKISEHLTQHPLPFMVDFKYHDDEILVRGQRLPILKMQWVDGLGLDAFVDQHLEQPGMLRQLLGLWPKLANRLRTESITHADLQHGNVMLVPMAGGGLQLKLIDYDGMHIPALSHGQSGEYGHDAYQHPSRLKQRIYSADVDRFSHLVIYTTIQGVLAGGRDLWQRYHSPGDNLLFKPGDFALPGESPLFGALWSYGESNLRSITGWLLIATQSRLEQIPQIDELVRNDQVRPLNADEERQALKILNGAIKLPGKSPLAARIAEIKPGRISTPAVASQPAVTELPDFEAQRSTPAVVSQPIKAIPEADRPTVRVQAVGQEVLTESAYSKSTVRRKSSFSLRPLRGVMVGMVIGFIGVFAAAFLRPRPQDAEIEKLPVAEAEIVVPPQAAEEPKPDNSELRQRAIDARQNAEAAAKKADAGYDSYLRPQSYDHGKQALQAGVKQFDDGDFVLAVSQFTAAEKLFDQAQTEAPLLNRMIDAQNAWNAAYSRVSKSRLEKYCPKAFLAVQEEADSAAKAIAQGNFTLAQTQYRNAILSLHKTGEEATLIEQLVNAIGKSQKTTAKDYLSQLEKQHPENSQLEAFRQQMARLPDTGPGSPDTTKDIPPVFGKAKQIRTFTGHSDAVRCVAFSPDGKYVLTGSNDNTAILWNLETGSSRQIRHGGRSAVLCAAFSPDSRLLITGYANEGASLWELATGIRNDLSANTSVPAAAFSSDGENFLIAEDRKALLFDMAVVEGRKQGSRFEEFKEENAPIVGIGFGSSRFQFITAAGESVGIWDSERKSKRSFTVSDPSIHSLGVAIRRDDFVVGTDTKAILVNKYSGQQPDPIEGHAGRITTVALSPYGDWVLTGSEDKTAIFWDSITKKKLYVLEGHTGAISSLVFSPDGTQVLTGSQDNTAILWNVDRREEEEMVVDPEFESVLRGTLDERVAGYKSLAKKPTSKSLDQLTKLEVHFITLIEEAKRAQRYDLVAEAYDAAITMNRQLKDANARSRLMSLTPERDWYKRLASLIERNCKDPNDRKTNTTLGKLMWLQTKDPFVGLFYLAKSEDPDLRNLAERDLAAPLIARDQVALGNAWWDVAEKHFRTDEPAGLPKLLRQRACDWYRVAQPKVTGSDVYLIRNRLQTVMYETP